jgi:hypothetical protein
MAAAIYVDLRRSVFGASVRRGAAASRSGASTSWSGPSGWQRSLRSAGNSEGGKPRVVFAFTITDGKVAAIEMIADPECISRLDLVPC